MKSQALVPFKAAASYEFGPILIDVASRKILRNGDSIVVPSKAFDALVYLAAHPDRTVTKDELIGAVWENMFVSEDSLFHSISVLRRALGDDSTHPQLIITVPRMGYRLRGPVRKVFGAPSDASEDADRSAATEREAALPIQPPIRGARWRWSTLWMLLSIPLVLFLLAREFLAARVLPGSTAILLTQNAPERATIASGGILSPDSRYMVFVAHDQKSVKARLYLKQMDSPELRLLAGTEGASHPFWSPESNVIGFFANGELKTIDLRGDILKAIAAVPVSAGGGTWSSDGTILFSDWQTGLYRVDSTDGRVIRVSTVNRSSGENVENLPQFLPDGRHFLFHLLSSTAGQTGSYVGSLDSPKRIRLLTQSSSPVVYSPSGHLLYVQDGILRAQRFDPLRLEVIGTPMVVARNVSAPGDADGQMISATPNLIAFRLGEKTQELAWFGRDGQRTGFVPAGQPLRDPMLSPDQRQLLAMDGARMWMVDLQRNAVTRLEGEGIYPLWSPDGSRIAFQSHNHLTLYVRNLSGAGQDEVVVNDDERKTLSDWSPEGNYLVYTTLNPSTKLDLVLFPMSGQKKPIPLLHTPFNESQGRIAPNGRWIAYVSDESGTEEVYVQRFPSLGSKRVVSIGGGVEPVWRQDGRELFYLSPDYSIVSVQIPADPTTPNRPAQATLSSANQYVEHPQPLCRHA